MTGIFTLSDEGSGTRYTKISSPSNAFSSAVYIAMALSSFRRDMAPRIARTSRVLPVPGGPSKRKLRVMSISPLLALVGDPTETGPAAFPIKVQPVFAERHAAAIKHTVIRVEKTMGVVKVYPQLKTVTATKQMASDHAMLRMRAKVSAGSPPISHANTAANKRNTEKKSPNALKKSQ
jgi:hypothetical protein